ncbi:MAG: aminotransferase class I/II-fold pyridoxal phosphate-dependent enzyme [Elusimicrobia bacterium]|nr:aminotransferase class I/II-fold pyridoxal phosphate-dependent enzyme [Elusimicrobiota bacterium]
MRRIPASGINLFQLIYVLIREYEAKAGRKALNLSLGNPDGVPPASVLGLKARFARDPGYAYHTYAEDNDINGFAGAMVELHGGIEVSDHAHLRCVPIPGIKTAGALIPLACGLHLPDKARRGTFKVVSNLPAYDVIGTWSDAYLGAERVVWPLSPEDGMRLNLARMPAGVRPDLVYVIRPGNPAAVGASAEEWRALIGWCLERGSRLVNDAAYAGLTEDASVPLAAVAKDFPELEWAELYSVSKSFNDPGARLGALVGSKDFVEDFILVKGNTESGPVPHVMAAYGEYFKDAAGARADLAALRGLYRRRLDYVIPRLKAAGLVPACPTEAGFFTLWRVPRRVLGADLPAENAHEAFNRRVIAEAGLVGVHFRAADGSPLIRYAVCADVLDLAFQERFEAALARLKPEY